MVGLGDERLKMVLEVGNVKPILFTNSKTGATDKLYSLFSVREALRKLQGVDVQMEYEQSFHAVGIDQNIIEEKVRNINLRIIKKQKAVG
jgi:hypothetical protein